MSKTNIVGSHLYVESKKNKFIEKEIRLVLSRARELGEGELGEGGLKGQTSSYKIN